MYHERNKGNATVVGAVNSRLGVGWDSSQRACEFGRPGQDQPVCSMMGSATDMSRQQTSVKLHRLRTTVVAYSAVVATQAGPCIHTYMCDSELVACTKLLPGPLHIPILSGCACLLTFSVWSFSLLTCLVGYLLRIVTVQILLSLA